MTVHNHIQTQSEWEQEMAEKILKFVQNELYLDLRYLKVALTSLQYKRIEGLETFATDGVYLAYSTEPLHRVFRQNAKFLNRIYLHSILHCIFRHLWLRKERKEKYWNLACDIAVEYVIDKMYKPSTKRILSFVRREMYERLEMEKQGISAAIIYHMLLGKEESALTMLSIEFYTDDHRFWGTAERENQTVTHSQAKKNWDKIAKQTTLEQNRQGDNSEEGERFLTAQIDAAKSRRSYQEFLQKFSVWREEMHCDMDEFDMNYYSYGFRVYGNMPLIEPVETREAKKIQEFVIVIDTSDSTSGELVEGFLQETYQILMQRNSFFTQSKIRILQCDNEVRADTVIRNGRDLEQFIQAFTFTGGGTTDFVPAFSYVESLRQSGEIRNLGGLLYFTDGMGRYPVKRPDYKTAFLFLNEYDNESVPAWAMRLRLKQEEFDEYQTGKTGN